MDKEYYSLENVPFVEKRFKMDEGFELGTPKREFNTAEDFYEGMKYSLRLEELLHQAFENLTDTRLITVKFYDNLTEQTLIGIARHIKDDKLWFSFYEPGGELNKSGVFNGEFEDGLHHVAGLLNEFAHFNGVEVLEVELLGD